MPTNTGDIEAFYAGLTPVEKLYAGSTEIWSDTPAVVPTVAPTLIESRNVYADENTQWMTGFNGIQPGELILAVSVNVGSVTTANAGELFGLAPSQTLGQSGSDVGGGWITNYPTTSLAAYGVCLPFWKFADGDEIQSYNLVKHYGYTSFGTGPNWMWVSRWSGVDPVNPVVARAVDWISANQPWPDLPSAPAGTVKGNSAEMIFSRRGNGNSQVTWSRQENVLLDQTDSSEMGQGSKVVRNAGTADGSILANTPTGLGGISARRLFVQGV